MQKLKAAIVDDEFKSRTNLKVLLEEFCPQVEVVALCQNVEEGIRMIKATKPDILFLDIQLQGETGFDLLNHIENINFELIFTTAYSEYAITAFKFSAIDYLLKPIDINDLQKAVQRAGKRVSTHLTEKFQVMIRNLKSEATENYRLSLHTSDGLIFIRLKDILYGEAFSNYTNFYTTDGKKYVVSKHLKEYEDLLTDFNFFRIHNSYLVNLQQVKKYIRGEGGHIILYNETTLDVSKRKKEAFLNRISGVSPLN